MSTNVNFTIKTQKDVEEFYKEANTSPAYDLYLMPEENLTIDCDGYTIYDYDEKGELVLITGNGNEIYADEYSNILVRGKNLVCASNYSHVDVNGGTVIGGGHSIVHACNAYVRTLDHCFVKNAFNCVCRVVGNSAIKAFNSHIEARDDGCVYSAKGNHIIAYNNAIIICEKSVEKSEVILKDTSTAKILYLNGYTEITAMDYSTVEISISAIDELKFKACDEIAPYIENGTFDKYVIERGNIQLIYKARIRYESGEIYRSIAEYCAANVLKYVCENGKYYVYAYKAVKKKKDNYCSITREDFIYTIGKTIRPDDFNVNKMDTCSNGIHFSSLDWAIHFVQNYYDDDFWTSFAILELKIEVEDILIPYFSSGKARAAKAYVVREVPADEWGILGTLRTTENTIEKELEEYKNTKRCGEVSKDV